MLIADEVGLGKTIEAGIVLTELHARESLSRVVIVCPSALTEKWRLEMQERFEWDFEVVDGTTLRARMNEAARNPYAPLRLIASLELARREENLQALQEHGPRIDLVIVDEAHHMRNAPTLSNALGEALSLLAETMIFLTATPLNLGNEDFFELLRLLVPEEFHDFADFADQIAPNANINAALRQLRRASPDFAAAHEALAGVEDTAQAERLLRDPRYRHVKDSLERASRDGTLDRHAVVRLQRQLVELNTLSYVFTRTKKREVSALFPLRGAERIPVEFSAAEQDFYDAVTQWWRVLRSGTDSG